MLVDRFKGLMPSLATWHSLGVIGKIGGALLAVYLLVVLVLSFYWSAEPDPFSVHDTMDEKLAGAR